jgi:citrate lyase subunit gamma (acyl carrier protein)
MVVNARGQAGTLESNDVLVTVELRQDGQLDIEVESIVMAQFGDKIVATAMATLKELEIRHGFVRIVDKGALDFAIRARMITAINRARGGEAS